MRQKTLRVVDCSTGDVVADMAAVPRGLSRDAGLPCRRAPCRHHAFYRIKCNTGLDPGNLDQSRPLDMDAEKVRRFLAQALLEQGKDVDVLAALDGEAATVDRDAIFH